MNRIPGIIFVVKPSVTVNCTLSHRTGGPTPGTCTDRSMNALGRKEAPRACLQILVHAASAAVNVMQLLRHSLHSYPRCLHFRRLSTESVPNSSTSSPPPPNPPSTSRASRSRLIPAPRPIDSFRNQTDPRIPPRSQGLPQLPHNFGANQFLSVPTTTRHLLESIVSQFDAPIRYAFAYGSGVFEQDGYLSNTPNRPMLDFMFAVSHPGHWHSINLARNPSHYALHARIFGSDFVSRMQDFGPGVWFNPYVTVNGTVRPS